MAFVTVNQGNHHMDLHAEVRETLAGTPAASAMAASITRPTVQETLNSGLGTAPLRRLTAYYAHGPRLAPFNEATLRDDMSWVRTHLDEWMRRQTQAQDEAQTLLATLRSRDPAPAAAAGAGHAERLLAATLALQSAPDHWLHQPWADELRGRWTESLPAAVARARRWLAERPAP